MIKQNLITTKAAITDIITDMIIIEETNSIILKGDTTIIMMTTMVIRTTIIKDIITREITTNQLHCRKLKLQTLRQRLRKKWKNL